jgi:hypothetical protein
MIILLCRKIGRWQDTIIDDIRNGTISGKFDISLRIREAISRRLKPDARRADELKAMIEEGGNLSPRRFWPNLRIIECWKGGMMRLYLKELGDYFGNVPTRDMGCISTEARSSIPVNDTDPGGILAIQTNFYEFIPRRDAGKGSARTLTCGELKAGEEYFLIVTTAGGLYRYYIDDIVRVYGFFNRTPMIEFVQKGHGATSLAGEKLYESHVNEALEKVLDKHKIALAFFCAVAKAMDGPRYDLLAEFSSGAGDDDKKLQFLRSRKNSAARTGSTTMPGMRSS